MNTNESAYLEHQEHSSTPYRQQSAPDVLRCTATGCPADLAAADSVPTPYQREYGFFLEFDRGSVRPAPLRAKFAAYQRTRREGRRRTAEYLGRDSRASG